VKLEFEGVVAPPTVFSELHRFQTSFTKMERGLRAQGATRGDGWWWLRGEGVGFGQAGMEQAKGKAKALQRMLGRLVFKGEAESKGTRTYVENRARSETQRSALVHQRGGVRVPPNHSPLVEWEGGCGGGGVGPPPPGRSLAAPSPSSSPRPSSRCCPGPSRPGGPSGERPPPKAWGPWVARPSPGLVAAQIIPTRRDPLHTATWGGGCPGLGTRTTVPRDSTPHTEAWCGCWCGWGLGPPPIAGKMDASQSMTSQPLTIMFADIEGFSTGPPLPLPLATTGMMPGCFLRSVPPGGFGACRRRAKAHPAPPPPGYLSFKSPPSLPNTAVGSVRGLVPALLPPTPLRETMRTKVAPHTLHSGIW